jgi:prevent-host-death family protein
VTTSYLNTLEAKEEFSELINRVSHHKEHIVLTRRGKEIAAIIPHDDFLLLQKSLRKSDLDDAMEALQEARSKGAMTLEDFKTQIG